MNMGGDDAGVRAVPEDEVSFGYDEPAGLGGVVGNGKRSDAEVTDRERFAIPAGVVDQRFCGGPAVIEEIGQGSFRGMNRNIQFPGQHIHPPCVVAVLVGNKQRIDPSRVKPGPFHPGEDLLCAQAGIDKDRAAVPLKDNTVAFAPAGKHGTAHSPNYLPSSY
jgi:hypothetical protein